MLSTHFTEDFTATPYWWDQTPRRSLPATQLPDKADVVIVGSGYTGLCAALQVARAGRSTVVIDAQDAGWGCSSRNGGQIGTSVKPEFAALAKKHDSSIAYDIIREGQNALAWIESFVANEGIDCSFEVPGRFHAAHTPRQYEALARSIENQPAGLEVPAFMVARNDQRNELGTDAYFGGVVYEKHASLDPGRYHDGLLTQVLAADATVVTQCRATDIRQSGIAQTTGNRGFKVETDLGSIQAKDVIVATNGYSSALTPWLARRVIPIGSYIIATEPLPEATMNEVMPTQRVLTDTRKLVYYYRPSPDRQRILFGGRVTGAETSLERSGLLLRNELVRLFPQLGDVRISHSWMGYVAYTFDTLAHIGCHDGIHYAMGYCGSGVSMASYFGTRIGQQVLGLPEGRTGLDNVQFPTRPFYTGKPWFLPATVAYYRWRDKS